VPAPQPEPAPAPAPGPMPAPAPNILPPEAPTTNAASSLPNVAPSAVAPNS
jgi:hypothetical protein